MVFSLVDATGGVWGLLQHLHQLHQLASCFNFIADDKRASLLILRLIS
jgi:hypothetical protein